MFDPDFGPATEANWDELWGYLTPTWRRMLGGTDGDTPPPLAPILRRRRVTSDFAWVHFEPVGCFPNLDEALLWEENGIDALPLRGRDWRLLQLGGPGRVDLAELAGTRIERLILTNVDVADAGALREIVGLRSLTLTHGDFGALPRLDGVAELVLYDQVTVDDAALARPGPRVRRAEGPYWPPFGPHEVDQTEVE